MKVLFVCHGNLNRSAAAEIVARASRPDLEVRSAGVGALPGRITARKMRDALAARGYAETSVRSSALTEEMLQWADVVFYFDSANKSRLMSNWSGHSLRFRSLGALVGLERIRDPHFHDFHDEVLEQIERAVATIQSSVIPE